MLLQLAKTSWFSKNAPVWRQSLPGTASHCSITKSDKCHELFWERWQQKEACSCIMQTASILYIWQFNHKSSLAKQSCHLLSITVIESCFVNTCLLHPGTTAWLPITSVIPPHPHLPKQCAWKEWTVLSENWQTVTSTKWEHPQNCPTNGDLNNFESFQSFVSFTCNKGSNQLLCAEC